ncbi:RHS repeat domain-containing protein [Siminovitchia sp. 179-K 8D1 HS]|uniref:RHS repeat domain-containing protein n=1 Tax=Siminovitchia sp. 179-K 8D1 HS TaxID=3142385 RepID=UPI0039A35DB9
MYSADGQLLALNKHSGNTVTATYYYHYNPRGDVIALTDQSGNVVASYSYDSWGNPLEAKRTGIALENPFRYAGYQYDEETGLYYLMARYYHPTHRVFLSMDPDPGDEDDILTQNGYTYANNNLVMMVDPDGKWFWLAVNAGFAAYDGYKAYRAGKSKKQIAWAVASGFGPGRYFKGAKKAVGFAKSYKLSRKNVKVMRSASLYKDITKRGSIKNRETNISMREFEKNLRRNGYKKSVHGKGVITMEKNGNKYSLRNHSKSGRPTAEFIPKGRKKATLKIRFR